MLTLLSRIGVMKKLAQSKVLVTGAGGFIGSHLCELCLAEGAEVRAFVHYNSRSDWGMLEDLDRKSLKNIDVMAGDLRDFEAVRRAVRGCNRVFHLGALIGIPYSYLNPTDVIQTNILGSLHVLQAGLEFRSRAIGSDIHKRGLWDGSICAYGRESIRSILNLPTQRPRWGATNWPRALIATYGLPVVILRPFNTYGPRQSPRAVIPAIIIQALRSRVVHLGSLETKRDLTFVKDTARGFIAASTAPKIEGETIQLGSQHEYSISELVDSYRQHPGQEIEGCFGSPEASPRRERS